MTAAFNESRSVWVVTEVYYPEMISTGYYLTSVAEGVAQVFPKVGVICGQPNYAARDVKAPSHEIKDNVEIRRGFTTTLNKDVIPFRIVNMLVLGCSIFWHSLRRFKRGDTVLVVTAPPSLPYSTAIAALLKGSQYILLLHDCYPDILVAVGKVKPTALSVRLLHRINRWLFKHASKIIVVGRDMKERMLEKTEGLDIPITVIPNWADLENITPRSKKDNPILNELKLTDKFVFMYAGNIGHPTDIETIVEGAHLLKDTQPDVHFIFVGSGAKKAWLDREVADRDLTNVTILGQLPRSAQDDFLNACDVGIVSLVPGMWGTAMPSRTYNIMAVGRPIFALTDENSELARVIDEEGIGWHIRPGNTQTFVEAVGEILNARNELAEKGEKASAAAKAKYSRNTAVEAYREVLLT